LLPAHRIQRFARRALPWRGVLIILLTVATVPALAIGLATAGNVHLAGALVPPYPAPTDAVLLVAAPLAAPTVGRGVATHAPSSTRPTG
jgi:hypothetical protein